MKHLAGLCGPEWTVPQRFGGRGTERDGAERPFRDSAIEARSLAGGCRTGTIADGGRHPKTSLITGLPARTALDSRRSGDCRSPDPPFAAARQFGRQDGRATHSAPEHGLHRHVHGHHEPYPRRPGHRTKPVANPTDRPGDGEAAPAALFDRPGSRVRKFQPGASRAAASRPLSRNLSPCWGLQDSHINKKLVISTI